MPLLNGGSLEKKVCGYEMKLVKTSIYEPAKTSNPFEG